jgi:hypothetical protein
MMSSPSEVVAWVCGACTYTNEDATCCNCIACQTRRPVCYAIVAGTMAAVMARTTKVDCCKQVSNATLATAVPAISGEALTSANGAIAGEVPTATNGPPAVAEIAAMHTVQAPQLGRNCASVVACLVNMMVDIVGTSTKDRGRNCPYHACCGMQLQVGSKVCFCQE